MKQYRDSVQAMLAEVDAFVRQGMNPEDAKRMVGLSDTLLTISLHPIETIRFLPTPQQIENTTRAIRNGDVIVSEVSAARWRLERSDSE